MYENPPLEAGLGMESMVEFITEWNQRQRLLIQFIVLDRKLGLKHNFNNRALSDCQSYPEIN